MNGIMDNAVFAEFFRRFAATSCRGESPLYEQLCLCVADDPRLLEIVHAAPAEQPAPNLFLAAVHFLLLSGVEHDLGGFYGSCTAEQKPPQGVFPAFRDFCLTYEAAIQALMRQRRVQTNEVRRCAYLFPAFAQLADESAPHPLALIEVGASGGLNLTWDRYAYDFGTGRTWGCTESRVRIATELRGSGVLPLPEELPVVAHRVGVDLHVVNVADPAEALWLRSLVWPDQPERMKLLTDAIEECRSAPPELREGDALDLLPGMIHQAPSHAIVCVYHCHTLNQFSEQQRREFDQLLAAASLERPVIQLSAEWIFTPTPQLIRTRWQRGQSQSAHLADVDHHGRWIEWLESR
jgi:hypothetical protein